MRETLGRCVKIERFLSCSVSGLSTNYEENGQCKSDYSIEGYLLYLIRTRIAKSEVCQLDWNSWERVRKIII